MIMNKTDYKLMGQSIKFFRKLRNYSRVDFAKMINISPFLLDKIENGTRNCKSHLPYICCCLYISEAELYEHVEILKGEKKESLTSKFLKNKLLFSMFVISFYMIIEGIIMNAISFLYKFILTSNVDISNLYYYKPIIIIVLGMFKKHSLFIEFIGVILFITSTVGVFISKIEFKDQKERKKL